MSVGPGLPTIGGVHARRLVLGPSNRTYRLAGEDGAPRPKLLPAVPNADGKPLARGAAQPRTVAGGGAEKLVALRDRWVVVVGDHDEPILATVLQGNACDGAVVPIAEP
jgi:hypothetical protein